MKPLSPVLFLTAVQAAAVFSRTSLDETDCALQFVNRMGYLAHLDGTFASSSWPLSQARTVEELLQQAGDLEMLRHTAAAGDLVVYRRPRFPSVAVVLAVLEQGIGPVGRTVKCRVLFARAVRRGTVRVECRDLWCRESAGDRFVRWYDGRHEAITRSAA